MDIISQLETLKSLADAITELSHEKMVVDVALVLMHELDEIANKLDDF